MQTPSRHLTPSPRRVELFTASICGFIALATYWLTVAPSASFWDCPEYILTSVGLEIGHPPGNPAWQLFTHTISLLAPTEQKALAINLTSGLFTALAIFFTCRITFTWTSLLLRKFNISQHLRCTVAAISSACGSLALAWCDSVWFSAVEAEVYAMSLFLTALSVWLITAWCRVKDSDPDHKGKRIRLLVLSAYILGISIGVHQLNLLVVPALALMMYYRSHPSPSFWRPLLWMALGCGIIILLLKGMLPGTAAIAAQMELLWVNAMHLPYNSGVIFYLCLCIIAITLAPLSTEIGNFNFFSRLLRGLCSGLLIFCSGILMIIPNVAINAVLSFGLGFLINFLPIGRSGSYKTGVWMLAATLTGFGIYLLIPLRSASATPINESQPSDVFSYLSYVNREQYGSKSLLYGPTPYSRAVTREIFKNDSTPSYTHYLLDKKNPIYIRHRPGMRIANSSTLLSGSDSILFSIRQRQKADAYQLVDYRFDLVDIPELNMLFSRLQGRSADDIASYQAWAGMDTATMQRVEISEAIDSAGNYVSRLDTKGERLVKTALKPTQYHNLRFLAGYQIGYMYLRYLLWNFSGRQNDIPSTGEIDHGNFITGIPIIDDAMLGPQSMLPPSAGQDNPGHNNYYMLPFLLGIAGAVWSAFTGNKGRRYDTVILVLFILTGIAIVIYLNQNTGEARERDYSFLGSYMAFSLWISAGAAGLSMLVHKFCRHNWCNQGSVITSLLTLGIPILMFAENLDDHDRSGNNTTTDYAVNILESLDKDAIIFVDGDNLTFPLWYAQEILGVREDVRIISCTYLTQPGYALQLMTPLRNQEGVRFVARPEEIVSGRFASTSLPSDTTMVARDAVEMLRELYSNPDPRPSLPTSRLTLKGIPPHKFSLNLRKASNGSSTIKRRQLLTLDIIAANYASEKPRPIYFVNLLNSGYYAGCSLLAFPELFAIRLGNAEWIGNRTAIQSTLDKKALLQIPKVRYGGFNLSNPPYTDLTVHRETSYQRSAQLALAERLLMNGYRSEAFNIADEVLKNLPPSYSPMRTTAILGEPFDETTRAINILLASAQNEKQRTVAKNLLKKELAYSLQWRNYINAMGKRAKAVSRHSKAISGRTDILREQLDSIQALQDHIQE